jgi:hypothetical protein
MVTTLSNKCAITCSAPILVSVYVCAYSCVYVCMALGLGKFTFMLDCMHT